MSPRLLLLCAFFNFHSGVGLYLANNRMESRGFLSFFMSGLTLFLSVGLFVGGMHEFEENFPNGESKSMHEIENELWSSTEGGAKMSLETETGQKEECDGIIVSSSSEEGE